MRMKSRWLLIGTVALLPLRGLAAPEPLRGVGFDENLSSPSILAGALSDSVVGRSGLPIHVRLVVDRDALEPRPGVYDFTALDARIASHRALGIERTLIELRDTGRPDEGIDGWGRFVRALAGRYRGAASGYVFSVRPRGAGPSGILDDAFYLKSTSVNLRAADEDALVVLGGVGESDASWLSSLYGEDLAAYVDMIGIVPGGSTTAILETVEAHDPDAWVVILGQPLGDDPELARRRFLDSLIDHLGTRVAASTWVGPPEVVAAVLPAIERLAPLLAQQLVPLDEEALGLRLTSGGRELTAAVAHRLLFGVADAMRYFIYSEPERALDLQLSEPTGRRPMILDPLGGTRRPPRTFSYEPSGRVATIGLPAASWPMVVDWREGDEPDFAAMQDVSSSVLPGVAEILARHQQAQTAQEGLVHSYLAHATMELHFRPTAADPGFDIETQNRFFVEGDAVEWEELSFRLNGTSWGPNRPPLPLLQAEKVLSLPLDLRLNADYRYRLEGVESVNGRECYAIRFDPIDEERSLLRGTVWIDRTSWLKAKVQSVQTRLSPPIVSSEETQFYSPAATIGSRPIHLLERLVTRQIMLVAGRSILVEREIRFAEFELNPSEFVSAREAARVSDNIMFRDTEKGVRYLVKRDGERVVEDQTRTSALAALIGVTYDPSYDYPLPLGGINYLDFNFLGEDNQLAVVFGGVLALVNAQRPRLVGERVDGSIDLFAIALEGSDRVYDASGEREEERLLTRPFSTAIRIGWRATEFQRIVASYQFRYDHVSADDETSSDFLPPVSTATHGVGLAWEWKRAGFSLSSEASRHERDAWEPWGGPGDYDPNDRDYLKYSAIVAKDFFAGFHKFHVNAAYFGGEDLDRFSMYQFGFFDDTRVHGVPSSGVRFGELGMLRGSYSLNLLEQYRLDLFLDQAWGRDRRSLSSWESVSGVGVGFTMRGPWNTLLRGDVGKSFLPREYREPGSIVVQFQILKPL